MKILFLYPKWTGDYGLFAHFAKRAGIYPPLNLAYLAAIAESLGHEAIIVDGEAERLNCEQVVAEALNFNPDMIAMTGSTPFFHFVEEMAINLKKVLPKIPILLGGPHVSVLRENAFKDCFDYCFIGEADKSFESFLRRHEKGQRIDSIPGIFFRDGANVQYTGDIEPVVDMDSLLLPAYHLLKMEKYKIGTIQDIKNFATVMTVRGCPFQCIFCSTKVFGNNIRKRSPRFVVDEIKLVKEKCNLSHFIFLDDTLTLYKKHILEICDLIIREKLNITFEGSTRANLIDEELITKLKQAGMIRISFGLESVDEGIRKTMRKEVPLESYITANRLTNRFGIETLNSCMIGLPGETRETVKKTLSFLRNSKEIKQANISIAVPYPGTELYEMALKRKNKLELTIDDFSKFRRYNSAVMKVGNLTTKELIQIQNDAFASIYMAPWRWIPVLKKYGLWGLILTFSRFSKSLSKKSLELLFVDKDCWRPKESLVH